LNQGRQLLVTGGSGFIGQSLLRKLSLYPELRLFTLMRGHNPTLPKGIVQIQGSFLDVSAKAIGLSDIDVVVHTAALIHKTNGSSSDLLSEFRKVNVEGTLNLARKAAKSGVRRFIFISSIKVNGEFTLPGKPFTPYDQFSPQDFYSVSKCEAEIGLYSLAEKTGMEVVIIRPPLVYGPGVKGNFSSILRILKKGIPLPLGAVHNKRSLVALDNLLDLIVTCIDHPNAANQTFLAGDGDDLSTTELLQRLGKGLGQSPRLIPIPVGLLTFVAVLLGKRTMAQRLCGSLQVDISKAREMLDWVPPITVDEGIRRAVEGFND